MEYVDEPGVVEIKAKDLERDNGGKTKVPVSSKQASPTESSEVEMPLSGTATPTQLPRTKPRLSFKTASQATLSFLSARRKVEAGLKHWNNKKKQKKNSAEEQCEGRSMLRIVMHV